jgi:hypothetical protein
MLRRSFLTSAALAPFALAADPKFTRVFFHDIAEVSSGFTDFAFAGAQRGFATGVQQKGRGRPEGFLLSSKDGGVSWQQEKLRFIPRTLFALESGSLWALSDKEDLWFSAEYGLDWRKLSKVKNVRQVHFLDAQNGFAFGDKKTALRTSDGGRKWSPIAEVAELQGDPQKAAFLCAASYGGKLVSIFGNSQANAEDLPSFMPPEWMDPRSAAALRRERPALTLALDSSDGGKTFKTSNVSAFGRVSRVRIAEGGEGIILIRFNASFPYGGEVYRFAPGKAESMKQILRPKDVTLSDALYIPGQGYYAAGTQRAPEGQMPIPSPVKVLFSPSGEEFFDVAVDYRAEARSVILAQAGKEIFAATDEGMILQLK